MTDVMRYPAFLLYFFYLIGLSSRYARLDDAALARLISLKGQGAEPSAPSTACR